MAYRTSSLMLPACCMELALTQSQNRTTALWWWTLWLAVPCASTARPQTSGRVFLSWGHPTPLALPSSEHLSPACYMYQRPSVITHQKARVCANLCGADTHCHNMYPGLEHLCIIFTSEDLDVLRHPFLLVQIVTYKA